MARVISPQNRPGAHFVKEQDGDRRIKTHAGRVDYSQINTDNVDLIYDAHF